MIEQETHSILAGIDGSDAALECGDEVVHRFEQYIGQKGSLQVWPQSRSIRFRSGQYGVSQ